MHWTHGTHEARPLAQTDFLHHYLGNAVAKTADAVPAPSPFDGAAIFGQSPSLLAEWNALLGAPPKPDPLQGPAFFVPLKMFLGLAVKDGVRQVQVFVEVCDLLFIAIEQQGWHALVGAQHTF